MTNSSTDPTDRVRLAFEQLADAAGRIKTVSDGLGAQVVAIERALQSLNVGVACWVTLQKSKDETGYYTNSDLGYTRFNRRWCLVVRVIRGVADAPPDDVERWPLNEAPRFMRAKAITRIPELLESLVKATNAATVRLGKLCNPTEEWVEALQESIPSGAKRGQGDDQ